MADNDLPIALRRTRRSSAYMADAPPLSLSKPSSSTPSSVTKTPKRNPKKRVRFSDPGASNISAPNLSSTGLTPMIRRTSLTRGSGTTPSKRRHSTPARSQSRSGNGNGNGNGNNANPSSSQPLPRSGEVHFLPLRQVLDGRIQRRIRRNRLSEEMNTITDEKRQHAHQVVEEMENLRAQLSQKDEEIYQLQNATIVLDTDRIWELERQVTELRDQLDDKTVENRSRTYEWTLAARDPFGDYSDRDEGDAMDMDHQGAGAGGHGDEEGFGDATAAELVCSTPTRSKGRMAVQDSFPSPPLTSPVTIPATPSSRHGGAGVGVFFPPTPSSHHAGVQADLPDPEKQRLEEERVSLQLEVCKLNTTLEGYSSLSARLSERLADFTPPAARTNSPNAHTDPSSLESNLTHLLQTLSDRTVALQELTTSLTTLGFPGADASEIISSLASGFRTARLELEYLTPGEIALPLSHHGAEVLDLLLSQLRDMAKKAREDEATVDEYHALELSLRQQLGARVAAMDGLVAELRRAKDKITEGEEERIHERDEQSKKHENQLRQRDEQIAELEIGLDRLKGATESYVRDIAELEALVARVEGEGRDAGAAKDARIEAGRLAVEAKKARVAELEARLAEAVVQTETLKKQVNQVEAASGERAAEAVRRGVDEVRAAKDEEVAGLNARSGKALALRDARIAELRGEVERVNGALRAAHVVMKDVRVEQGRLEGRLRDEKTRAKEVVEGLRGELSRVLRESACGEDLLATPDKGTASKAQTGRGEEGVEGVPGSPLAQGAVVRRGSLLAGDLARKPSNGRKRRRYDSGLGFMEEDEIGG